MSTINPTLRQPDGVSVELNGPASLCFKGRVIVPKIPRKPRTGIGGRENDDVVRKKNAEQQPDGKTRDNPGLRVHGPANLR